MKFIVLPKKTMGVSYCSVDCSGNCAAKCGSLGACFCPFK